MNIYRINITGSRAKKANGELKLLHLLKVRGIPYTINDDGSINIKVNSPNENRNGIHFIDLKPFFALSSKAKQSKNGWYLKVPIQPGKGLNGIVSPGDKTALDNLMPGQTIHLRDIEAISSSPNITGAISNNNMGPTSTPTLFRTVSNNSPSNSWITRDIDYNNIHQNMASTDVKNINLDTNDLEPSDETTSDVLNNLNDDRSIPENDDFSNLYNSIPKDR